MCWKQMRAVAMVEVVTAMEGQVQLQRLIVEVPFDCSRARERCLWFGAAMGPWSMVVTSGLPMRYSSFASHVTKLCFTT